MGLKSMSGLEKDGELAGREIDEKVRSSKK